MKTCELAIVGGGPAALQLGLYAGTEGLDARVFLKDKPGGQIIQTPRLENLMGQHPSGISGKEFIGETLKQCLKMGVKFIDSPTGVTGISRLRSKWRLWINDEEWTVCAVVLAVGTVWTMHDVLRECEPRKHIFYGPYETRCVPLGHYAVIGSANSAAQGILELAQRGCEVSVLCRHDLECSNYLKQRIRDCGRISVRTGVTCKDVLLLNDDDLRLRIKLSNNLDMYVKSIFVMAGQLPCTEFLSDSKIRLDANGYVCHHALATNGPGVFTAGDCRTGITRRSLGNALGDANEVFAKAWRYMNSRLKKSGTT